MKCQFKNEKGASCEAFAMKSDQYCFFHNPNITDEQRREAQSKGGKGNIVIVSVPLPPIMVKEVKDVVLLLEDTINRVRSGDIDVRVGNCIGALSGHLIRALEVSSVASRVEIIERAILEKRTSF